MKIDLLRQVLAPTEAEYRAALQRLMGLPDLAAVSDGHTVTWREWMFTAKTEDGVRKWHTAKGDTR